MTMWAFRYLHARVLTREVHTQLDSGKHILKLDKSVHSSAYCKILNFEYNKSRRTQMLTQVCSYICWLLLLTHFHNTVAVLWHGFKISVYKQCFAGLQTRKLSHFTDVSLFANVYWIVCLMRDCFADCPLYALHLSITIVLLKAFRFHSFILQLLEHLSFR